MNKKRRIYPQDIQSGIFIFLIIAISLFGIILFMDLAFFPRVKSVNQMVAGVKFQRVSESQYIEKIVTLQIQGEISTNIKGVKTYRGKFKVLEEGINDPRVDVMNRSDAIIEFGKEKGVTWGEIIYPHTGYYGVVSRGILYINHDFSKFSISVAGINEIIAAPASSRSEGLEIIKNLTPWDLN